MKKVKRERVVSPYNGNEHLTCHFCVKSSVREIEFTDGKQISLCPDHNKIFEVIFFIIT